MSELRAGASFVEFDLEPGIPMMGYANRKEAATGQHRVLGVRALYLGGAVDVLWVHCEVCLMSVARATALRERIAVATGVPSSRICLACTHTHSGPDTGLADELALRDVPEFVDRHLGVAVEAAARAVRSAVPARLGSGVAEAKIGRNRCRADGAIDEEVLVLRVDRCDGTPLAVWFAHGCHPTALGHDNTAYSPDWPGAAIEEVERALPGAVAIFALGAHADVDPRTRDLQDIAISDQSSGVTFDETDALGREVGRDVARVASGIETVADVKVAAARTFVPLAVHPGGEDAAAREGQLEASRLRAWRALELAPETRLRIPELFQHLNEQMADLPRDLARERIAAVRGYVRDRTASQIAGGAQVDVEVQRFQIGDADLLALPLESTVDVGLDWKRRLPGRRAVVLSIANGWLRYLPHTDHFEAPDAHTRYEILTSTLVADAATRLLDAAQEIVFDVQGRSSK